jgi:hypothetical protein
MGYVSFNGYVKKTVYVCVFFCRSPVCGLLLSGLQRSLSQKDHGHNWDDLCQGKPRAIRRRPTKSSAIIFSYIPSTMPVYVYILYIHIYIYMYIYNIHIQYTIFNIQYTIYNMQYAIYNIQYKIYNIQYTHVYMYTRIHVYTYIILYMCI